MSRPVRRNLPVGAEVLAEGGVHFRVWAPNTRSITLVLEAAPGARPTSLSMTPERDGYFAGHTGEAGAGTRYRYRIDGVEALLPDPASRYQPEGPHGPSQVVDPSSFAWNDDDWKGPDLHGQILYEMHVGTFTPEGTWRAAMDQLEELARLGITLIEMMPIAEFAGKFGWGYDGVDLFAPSHLYGEPDDLRRFVDRAHEVGIGVILDVVYNHLGADGNYLPHFSEHYFSKRYKTDWGPAFNFDDEHAGPVREFILANACYWIDEFHFDGFRVDATQDINDASEEHILAALSRGARETAGDRKILIIAENEPQEVRCVLSVDSDGFGMDAVWNDDFHHAAIVALTGRTEAYCADYRGTPQEIVSAVKWGYLYQGQHYVWQGKRRGTPTFGLDPAHFVNYLQNHDQVANSARGLRIHQLTTPGRFRAMTTLLLLAPGTPLLMQGQEFAASSPFLYFADPNEDLQEPTRSGRAEFLEQFRSIRSKEMKALLADPSAAHTFERSRLDLSERESHAPAYDLHRDLIRLRRADSVFSALRPHYDGAILGPEAFLIRYFGEAGDDRLLLVNLGRDLQLAPIPEPLLAPPAERQWSVLFSSEHPKYGGSGAAPLAEGEDWWLTGHAALILTVRK